MSNNQGYTAEERIAELVLEELNKSIDTFPPKAVCCIALQEYLNMSTDGEVLNYLNFELQKPDKTVLLIALEAAFGQEVPLDKLEEALSIAKTTQAQETPSNNSANSNSQDNSSSMQQKFESTGMDALVKISKDSATIYNNMLKELCNKYKDPGTDQPLSFTQSLALLGEELTNYPIETQQELILLYDRVTNTNTSSPVEALQQDQNYSPYDDQAQNDQQPSGPLSLEDVAKYAKQMHQRDVANKFAIHLENDVMQAFTKMLELSGSTTVSSNQLPANLAQNLKGDDCNRTITTLANMLKITPEKIVTTIEKANKELDKIIRVVKTEAPKAKTDNRNMSETISQCPITYAMLTHLQQNGFPPANILLDFLLPEYRSGDGHSLSDLEDALQPEGDIQAVCYTIAKGIANSDEKQLLATAPKIAVELVKENGIEIVEGLLFNLAQQFVNNYQPPSAITS